MLVTTVLCCRHVIVIACQCRTIVVMERPSTDLMIAL